jgi:hypothetical protein
MAGRTINQDLYGGVRLSELSDRVQEIVRGPEFIPAGYVQVPIQPLGSRTRECAVIASSIQNFNNWRNETFDRSSVFIITNRDFTHTNGNNNQTTRYRAITRIDDCYGLTFDDYITTDRIEGILSSVFDDTIDSIRQLIVEVNLHTRDNETI